MTREELHNALPAALARRPDLVEAEKIEAMLSSYDTVLAVKFDPTPETGTRPRREIALAQSLSVINASPHRHASRKATDLETFWRHFDELAEWVEGAD